MGGLVMLGVVLLVARGVLRLGLDIVSGLVHVMHVAAATCIVRPGAVRATSAGSA